MSKLDINDLAKRIYNAETMPEAEMLAKWIIDQIKDNG
jgi:hypothetical protein